jgi:hypothetical protein
MIDGVTLVCILVLVLVGSLVWANRQRFGNLCMGQIVIRLGCGYKALKLKLQRWRKQVDTMLDLLCTALVSQYQQCSEAVATMFKNVYTYFLDWLFHSPTDNHDEADSPVGSTILEVSNNKAQVVAEIVPGVNAARDQASVNPVDPVSGNEYAEI